MLQKIKERLKAWGYSFTVPGDPAADPEEPLQDGESTEEAEDLVQAEEPAEEEEPSKDELQILYLIAKTEQYIKNYCNIKEIPEELEYSEIDMVAIEFLREKAMAGGLDESSLQIGGISSITEGDVTVSFASGSAVTLQGAYDSIRSRFESDLLPFRRMRW